MAEDLEDETFQIIDSMYNCLYKDKKDQQLLNVLLKAAAALNKGVPPQIVATKTVNGFSLYVLTHVEESFGPEVNQGIKELTRIARLAGYKWNSMGLGDLRVQFE
ncbi:bacteriocin immunity protein [Companilactobacillus zhachilii]|uniref:Bacteriocin immunity protein n=1 Tax=Companilactobacillus zhachilii TaxID=2304606 RepID=A0A386PR02_9LACO|nr:bacteriocin immunity protein [Companilactobacillus zhachilii]AYE38304.1 bacteriocin immunity protein [Companilactobacillus zhachilii]MBL3530004.1 bacteriocin immunity protein [Companilactobacillus zhachilii]